MMLRPQTSLKLFKAKVCENVFFSTKELFSSKKIWDGNFSAQFQPFFVFAKCGTDKLLLLQRVKLAWTCLPVTTPHGPIQNTELEPLSFLPARKKKKRQFANQKYGVALDFDDPNDTLMSDNNLIQSSNVCKHTETMCQKSFKGFTNQNQGKPRGIIHCYASVCFCFDLWRKCTMQTIALI